MTERLRGLASLGAALTDRIAPLAREVLSRLEAEARAALADTGRGLVWALATLCLATLALGFLAASLALALMDHLPPWAAVGTIGLALALAALLASGRARQLLGPDPTEDPPYPARPEVDRESDSAA
ncbi:MAG: phage holin family protein [Rhodospirillum sp.]|nr:phage holin family protein [Rhodospirillum sp.]MCF8488543.1 phage holin family protein [Rhodospirillum sp.]MCF8499139.1 phage holin family protein [Rhodospirillum sp.]